MHAVVLPIRRALDSRGHVHPAHERSEAHVALGVALVVVALAPWAVDLDVFEHVYIKVRSARAAGYPQSPLVVWERCIVFLERNALALDVFPLYRF